MSKPDWRQATAYEGLMALDATGFAWEFLRRNPEFQDQHTQLQQAARAGAVDPAAIEAFTGRWGLRFRGGGRAGPCQCSALGSFGAAERGEPGAGSG
jgi:Family of unknown function (DUF6499)